jgi:hypothetical protein
MDIKFASYYKDKDCFHAEYESKDKLTAKEVLNVLLRADKEIDLDKVIVTVGMPYVGSKECESFTITKDNLMF